MADTAFKQVKNNVYTSLASGQLNNTTSPLALTLANTEIVKFPVPGNGSYVTAWNAIKYPNPGDDPNMRIGLITAVTNGSPNGTMTITWGQLGTPIIAVPDTLILALLVVDQLFKDIHGAVNNLEDNLAALESEFAALAAELTQKQVKLSPTIGTTGSGADYECDGVADDVQFQLIENYITANNIQKYTILPGAYEFNAIVTCNVPGRIIEGLFDGAVTISPSATMSVSSMTADAFFTFYDYTSGDAVLSDITVKNIIFDYKGRIPASNRSPSAIRYWPYKGNSIANKPFTAGITSNQAIATIPAGYDVLYGWLENTTPNLCKVALSTNLPQITNSLLYPIGSAFKHVPSTQLPSGADLNPPSLITTNDTYLGVINAYFQLLSVTFTNQTANPVTFKLQAKPSSVLTNNPGDYADITADITIAGGGAHTIVTADLINGVFPNAVNQLIRIDQSGTTWSNVSLAVGPQSFQPVGIAHIIATGTYLGVVPGSSEITSLTFMNNTASPVSFYLEARQYFSQSARDDGYDLDSNWTIITNLLTIAASSSLTVKRSDFILDMLPDTNQTDIRIVQGATPWSGVDITLSSAQMILGLYDLYREVTLNGTASMSGNGYVADTQFGVIGNDYYVKSVTFTETAGHDWNGHFGDNNVDVMDRVYVPANGSVTVSHYGSGAAANPVIAGGAITAATLSGGGSNYDAAPIVQIQGDGTGATAVATISGGVVTGITITNGGSGYTRASINLLSLQRYNYVNPIPYAETFFVRGKQRPSNLIPNQTIWNGASINVSVTLGVKVGIRKELMNDIFPQSTSRTVYLVSTDNDYKSASVDATIQFGAVSKNFTLENIRIRGWNNTGFGAIEIVAGKALDSTLSIGVHDGMYFKNVVCEDSYYPVQASSTRMTHIHFTATFVRNIEFDSPTFRDLHGSSILWHGDAGTSLPIVVVRARKHIRVNNASFIRTKRGMFNTPRLEDWGDETRIGFRDLIFENPYLEEGTDGWDADFAYKTEGAPTPYSIADNGNSRSCLNFMNADDVVINSPRFIRVRTPIDYGYTNPAGNESHYVQVNNIYAEDCWELGDLDGALAVQFNGGEIIRLRTTGVINHYGNHNPTIYNGVYFEDPGIRTSPGLGILTKCLFQVHDGGVQFNNCTINLTKQQQIDYIFQEQNSNASPSLPIIYTNNKFMGIAPNVRTFGLNSAQYHRIIGNVGVAESSIQAVFSGTATPITPTAYLGTGFGNVDVNGNLIEILPAANIPALPYVKKTGDAMSGPLTIGNAFSVSFPNTASTSPAFLDAGNNTAILVGAGAFTLAATIQLDPAYDFTQNRYVMWLQNQFDLWVRTDGKVSGGVWGGFNPISSSALAAGGTYDIVFSFDGVSLGKVYVNAGTPASGTGGNVASGTNHLFIGKSSAAAVNGFMGSIDNVRIWNRALSDAEVSALHTTNLAPSSGLVLELGFDAKTLTDTSPTGNTVTATGTSFVVGISAPIPVNGPQEVVYGDFDVLGGKLGVGTISPTAAVDTPASTAANSGLRVRSGAAPTSPNSGDLWFDGAHLQFRNGAVTDQLDSQASGFTNPMSALGDLIYENSTPAAARLTGNITAVKQFLTQTGNGSVSAAPSWGGIAAADVPYVPPRVTSTGSSSTPTPNADTTDVYKLTALAVSATFGLPTGTPSDGQRMFFRIKDNGSAQTLAYNAIYVNSGSASWPAVTIAGKTISALGVYDSVAAAWVCMAADPVGY